jgi:hypothetical protein
MPSPLRPRLPHRLTAKLEAKKMEAKKQIKQVFFSLERQLFKLLGLESQPGG